MGVVLRPYEAYQVLYFSHFFVFRRASVNRTHLHVNRAGICKLMTLSFSEGGRPGIPIMSKRYPEISPRYPRYSVLVRSKQKCKLNESNRNSNGVGFPIYWVRMRYRCCCSTIYRRHHSEKHLHARSASSASVYHKAAWMIMKTH